MRPVPRFCAPPLLLVTQGCPRTSPRLPCVRTHHKQYRLAPICPYPFKERPRRKTKMSYIFCEPADVAWLPERAPALMVTPFHKALVQEKHDKHHTIAYLSIATVSDD
ncbi:unnamed protein product, partial [Ectocarpus fasciculatus]